MGVNGGDSGLIGKSAPTETCQGLPFNPGGLPLYLPGCTTSAALSVGRVGRIEVLGWQVHKDKVHK